MIESSYSLNTQAIELASQGEFKEAIACFKKAISIDANNYLLWFNLGITYRDAGDLVMAKEAMVKAWSINNEDDEIVETLALLSFNMGHTAEALKWCNEGFSLNENNSHIWNTLGVIHFNSENFQKASEAFERAITINPYYYDALFNLRDTYEEMGNQVGYLMCCKQMQQIKDQGKI